MSSDAPATHNGHAPALTRRDPEAVTPTHSQLDNTLERIDAKSLFRLQVERIFKDRQGECVSFDLMDIKFDADGLAQAAVHELVSAVRVELEQDDTLDDVRRKLAAELRAVADGILAT